MALQIALLGAGIYARDTYIPTLLTLADTFHVHSIYSRTLANAQSQAARFPYPVTASDDLDALLANPQIDAVFILLPIPQLPDVVQKALQAGKHILSEKPLAPDLASAHALLRFYADTPQQVWMVGEQWRYEDAFLQAKTMLEQGALGKIVLAQWSIFNSLTPSNKYYHTAWRRDGSFQRGIILDGGVHRTAALRMLLGEVEQVQAFVQATRPDLQANDDTFSANLRFKTGLLASFSTTYAAGIGTVQPLNLVGTEASLRIERQILEKVHLDGHTESFAVTPYLGTARQFLAFAAAIQDGHPHANSPLEAFHDLAIIEAIFQSAATGQISRPSIFIE